MVVAGWAIRIPQHIQAMARIGALAEASGFCDGSLLAMSPARGRKTRKQVQAPLGVWMLRNAMVPSYF